MSTDDTSPEPDQIYTDHRAYIDDAIAAVGGTRGSLAEHLGISKAMMSRVMNGSRRLKPEHVAGIAQYARLDDEQRQFLAALVDLENESEDARRRAWRVVRARYEYQSRDRPSGDMARVMASWVTQAVLELSRCEGFRSDPAWIADRLDPSPSVAEVVEAIDDLIRVGMLSRDEQGQITPAILLYSAQQRVPRDMRSQCVAQHQSSMMELAKRSLRAHDDGGWRASATTFALSESQYARIEARVLQAAREIMMIACDPGERDPTGVYQVFTQLYPMSGYTDSHVWAESSSTGD